MEPFAYRFERTHTVAEALAAFQPEEEAGVRERPLGLGDAVGVIEVGVGEDDVGGRPAETAQLGDHDLDVERLGRRDAR